ncbi:heme NO-binding domain-containing protein [Cohaesibacter gelatinilyticus]|uniref:Haem-NO-binding n=1 Tax=Cohaesibacter gelatinilyticus TaxID=372072 RepID=A0A285PGD2_9HYPH|nr:heme NO-binding domain-containing protein [Cohaesibacter gelatinilyticus]SNZ20353.1 Haem-NO-binding [Cohaesibacter gelatinilyticus]HAT84794.1 hypothetical protein [Hyphomicrobiales bacterium]
MKGIVFTEFIELMETKFGADLAEQVIMDSNLPSGGAYTSVGTYSHDEIVALVITLSQKTGIEISDLIQAFGTHLLKRFSILFPEFFSEVPVVTDFLSNVDDYIHGEVLKLYPDATLPDLDTSIKENGDIELLYKSDRMMGDLAEGLIVGAIDHFGQTHTYHREDLNQEGGAQCIRFIVTAR